MKQSDQKQSCKMNLNILLATLLIFLNATTLHAQTIAEKKAGFGQYVNSSDLSEEMRNSLAQVNAELEAQAKELQLLYAQGIELYQRCASTTEYQTLLGKIKAVREKRKLIESQWREMATQEQLDGYALWHQPNTTLEQLIIDYGSEDYVYLIPPEIAQIPLSVNSNLPIPRAAWNEMLEMILTQNGVGVKQLNPYLRELYLIKKDHSNLKLITNRRHNLDILPPNENIAFMLSPEPSDVKRIWFFLEKFINPNTVTLQQIGRDILIIAQVSEVLELLKLYDFISANRGDKEYKIVPLVRVDPIEMTKILGAIFGVLSDEPMRVSESPQPPRMLGGPPQMPIPNKSAGNDSSRQSSGDNGLQIIPLAQVASAIFLIGTREEIRKAEKIIRDVEEQVGEAHGKMIYWYTVRHSVAEELADVLSRIYYLMMSRRIGAEGTDRPYGDNDDPLIQDTINVNNNQSPPIPPLPPLFPPPGASPYNQGLFLDTGFVVNKIPRQLPPMANMDRDNFIVDLKTGTIVMVVEIDVLPKIKELIRKLDVPKKMVQLEVLLFEKRLNSQINFGLNMLRTGSKASHTNETGSIFNSITPALPIAGIFDFFISRTKTSALPAFDAVYRFLLSQDNIHINANPSVLTINQTPALIEIDEEISVNTGIYNVNTVGGPVLQNAFARARYGITIEITPTVHTQENDFFCDDTFWDGSEDYVTLVTDITFQTFQNSIDSRPDVTTRHINNEVNIPDGQTVILGGLRQRNSTDAIDRIPFLGDIPGVGVLFSNTALEDHTTEMFIFITPRIVYDPVEDLERIKRVEISRRPGDVPYFLCCLEEAEAFEQCRLFQTTLTMLLGRIPDRCTNPYGEYDGR